MAVPAPVAANAASLYVGDLHPDITEGVLFEFFREFKSLTSVRVCRDLSTGKSMCYAYVNFMNPQDAMCAIEDKNHSQLLGRMIRVAWSIRDPDARKNWKANVFIKNLSDYVDNTALQDMFKEFGNITSCKVAMSEDGKSKGFGFVQFDSEDSANAAIEKLNGSTSGGKQLYVAKFVRKSERVLSGLNVKYTNLYVKNLDPDVTEEKLREKFSEFGNITSLIIAKHNDGNSKGFGFVNFEKSDDAKKATETMNGAQLGSNVLYVARAQKKAEREEILRRQYEERRNERILKYKDANIYVKNIDDDVTDEELENHFSQCGRIVSTKIMRDNKGISKGFGFICFSSPEEASKAINNFHGFMFHRKPLYLAIAQRKEDRLAQMHLHYAQRYPGLTGSPAVIPGGYPPYYYTAPSGLISQASSQPGLMYRPVGLRPAWRAGGLAPPSRPGFQTPSLPAITNAPRDRHNRGRINPAVLSHGGHQTATYVPHLQQPIPSDISSKDSSNQQRTRHTRYVPNGRSRDVNNGSAAMPSASEAAGANGVEGTEMLSSMLAAASPEQQKQILGERLYPLVQKHKPDLVAKITGMLLEMDNSELLLLLESPESLAAKIEEAVQVLKLSKSKASGQESLHSGFLSAEVAVS